MTCCALRRTQVVLKDVGDVAYAFASHPASTLVLTGLVGVPLGVKAFLDRCAWWWWRC